MLRHAAAQHVAMFERAHTARRDLRLEGSDPVFAEVAVEFLEQHDVLSVDAVGGDAQLTAERPISIHPNRSRGPDGASGRTGGTADRKNGDALAHPA